MINDLHQLRFFADLRARSAPCVAVTVIRTEGSTYRKTGATMLIESGGAVCGLVSGGCLEGDLKTHAATVIDERACRFVTYDLRDDDEVSWGLGLGCNGLVELWLQPYLPGDYGALGACHRQIAAHRHCRLERVISTGSVVGFVVHDATGILETNLAPELARDIRDADRAGALPPAGVASMAAGERVIAEPLTGPLRLIVLGAGPDVVPLMTIAAAIGWETSVCDHRPGFLAAVPADHRIKTRPEGLAEAVDLDRYDACVVMSHHFFSDAAYLHALAFSRIAYIGLLGPRKRMQRLLADWEPARRQAFEPRLHNPVGLDLGGDSAEAIALAIAAQIQAVHTGRSGTSLSGIVATGP